MHRAPALLLCLAAVLGASLPAAAQVQAQAQAGADAEAPAAAADTSAAEAALLEIIAGQEALIRSLSERIDALEARVESLEAAPADTGIVVAGPETAAPALSEAERREQERLVRAAFQQTLIERGGLLLPAGAIDLEPSVSYLHSSADNIVIDGFTILPVLVVGDIVSERVDRELMQVSTTARIGLPWQSQLELSLPFSYHQQRRFSADNMERRISGSDFGDLGIGFSRQLTSGNAVWPDLLGSLRYQADSGTSPFDIDPEQSIATGTGFDSLNLAITGVKVVDPVVYFGSVTYTRNFGTDENLGRYDPGDSTGVSLGMAIALNLNSSLSFAYDQRRTRRAHVNGSGVPGSYLTTGVFSVGATFALGDSFTTDLSLGIGTTADSPDVQLQVAFPLRIRR